MANPIGATLKAKLAPRNSGTCRATDTLEKIVARLLPKMAQAEHPEVKKIDDEIQAAQVAKVPRSGQPETDGQAPRNRAARRRRQPSPVGPSLAD